MNQSTHLKSQYDSVDYCFYRLLKNVSMNCEYSVSLLGEKMWQSFIPVFSSSPTPVLRGVQALRLGATDLKNERL